MGVKFPKMSQNEAFSANDLNYNVDTPIIHLKRTMYICHKSRREPVYSHSDDFMPPY